MQRAQETPDWVAGAFLRHMALLEIRAMAGRRKALNVWLDEDYVACIRWLANLCDNMPFAPESRPWWRRRDAKRPFEYAWQVADPMGRSWILATLAKNGMPWTPPAVPDPCPSGEEPTRNHGKPRH